MINVAKKNPYVFTIGFDETDPVHVRAAEILNGTKKKAQLIASAILSYVDGVNTEKTYGIPAEAVQSLLKQLIQKELENIMKKQMSLDSTQNNPEKIMDLSMTEENNPMNENLAQNIVDAMDAFRRI